MNDLSVQQAVERLREHIKYPVSHPWTYGSRADLRTALAAPSDLSALKAFGERCWRSGVAYGRQGGGGVEDDLAEFGPIEVSRELAEKP